MGSPSKITSLGTTRFLTRLSAFLGRLPPGGKVAVMISTDALCLPVCMFVSVTLRLGAIDMALATSPWEQAALSLMALPIFAVSGVYNTLELTGRRPDATLMGVSAVLLGRERDVLEGNSPWSMSLFGAWGFASLKQSQPSIERIATEYFALMHLLTELANAQDGICQ